MSDFEAEVIVIGAGMAGASAAYQIAAEQSVIVLEAEDQAGYHSTGRSAALFSAIYGNASVRALSRASRPLYEAAVGQISDYPLLSPRGGMQIAATHQLPLLEQLDRETGGVMRHLTGAEARARTPILKEEAVTAALEEIEAAAIDVHGLHQGYLTGLRSLGGRLVLGARVSGVDRGERGTWRVRVGTETFQAPIVVNAAGAWSDEVARMAGIAPIGLSSRRRCAALIDPPLGMDVRSWPFTMDVAETYYFGPDAGRLLLSGAEETPVEPCDVQPDEIEIAEAVDRIEQATTLQVRRLRHKWAGLRTFAPDRTPVVGYDPRLGGFFWLAGQGGYGIQMAPAMGLLAAALVAGRDAPDRLQAEGVDPSALAPDRLIATRVEA